MNRSSYEYWSGVRKRNENKNTHTHKFTVSKTRNLLRQIGLEARWVNVGFKLFRVVGVGQPGHSFLYLALAVPALCKPIGFLLSDRDQTNGLVATRRLHSLWLAAFWLLELLFTKRIVAAKHLVCGILLLLLDWICWQLLFMHALSLSVAKVISACLTFTACGGGRRWRYHCWKGSVPWG